MKFLLMLLSVLASSMLLSQNIITGKILDAKTKTPIAYVNIGIIGLNIGTVSGSDGTYQLKVLPHLLDDTLQVSMVGYETQQFKVGQLLNGVDIDQTIYLSALPELMETILITGKKLKQRILGNQTTSRIMTGGFTSDDLGNEIGIRVKIKRSPTIIKQLHVSIAENTHKLLRFRVNLYKIKDNLPDSNILSENIIVNLRNVNRGVVTIDLSKYNIVTSQDFFISLEWIEDLGEGNLRFSVGLFGSPLFYRKTSQGVWEKESKGSIGMSVTVKD